MKQNFPLPHDAAILVARLSDRQRECLLLVGDGLSSKEIGRTLSLSPSTVDNHLQAAIERLGCSSRMIAAQILEAAEQADGLYTTGIERENNKDSHRNLYDDASGSELRRQFLLPPIGGPPNKESASRRVTHILLIAIAATMAFAAITITVAGVIDLFSG